LDDVCYGIANFGDTLYYLVGDSYSFSTNFDRDFLFIKINHKGDELLKVTYGTSAYEECRLITTDSKFIYVSAHSAYPEPNHDMMLFKLDTALQVSNVSYHGGSKHEGGEKIIKTLITFILLGVLNREVLKIMIFLL
jgi:hypothetical protein